MDSSSWFHGYTNTAAAAGNNGFMCGHAGSCTPVEREERQQQQQLLISSQIQHHLNEINMHMNMDDEPVLYVPSSINVTSMDMRRYMVDDFLPSHNAGSCFTSSPSSTSLSCSPESSAHVLTAPAATAGCQYPEVSSHVPLAPVVPYDHGQYTNLHVPTPAVHHDTAPVAPELPSIGAFKRYARHLGPRRPPKPGACGQRMFKTAMSVLAKIHMAMTYSHQYYYCQEAAAPAPPPPSDNQLQHMISERKRRGKLNDSFHALKTVLPPGSKKDKTSILIRAREYVNSLKSKVRELEEKNQALESRLARRVGTGVGEEDAEADAREKVENEITRASAAKEEEPRDLCTVKIAVRPPWGNMTDVVVRTMQCLKDRMGDDVSLVAMSTSGGGAHRANLTSQLKSTSGVKWKESVKEAVAKVVADALPQSQSKETTARHGDASTVTEQL